MGENGGPARAPNWARLGDLARPREMPITGTTTNASASSSKGGSQRREPNRMRLHELSAPRYGSAPAESRRSRRSGAEEDSGSEGDDNRTRDRSRPPLAEPRSLDLARLSELAQPRKPTGEETA